MVVYRQITWCIRHGRSWKYNSMPITLWQHRFIQHFRKQLNLTGLRVYKGKSLWAHVFFVVPASRHDFWIHHQHEGNPGSQTANQHGNHQFCRTDKITRVYMKLFAGSEGPKGDEVHHAVVQEILGEEWCCCKWVSIRGRVWVTGSGKLMEREEPSLPPTTAVLGNNVLVLVTAKTPRCSNGTFPFTK